MSLFPRNVPVTDALRGNPDARRRPETRSRRAARSLQQRAADAGAGTLHRARRQCGRRRRRCLLLHVRVSRHQRRPGARDRPAAPRAGGAWPQWRAARALRRAHPRAAGIPAEGPARARGAGPRESAAGRSPPARIPRFRMSPESLHDCCDPRRPVAATLALSLAGCATTPQPRPGIPGSASTAARTASTTRSTAPC